MFDTYVLRPGDAHHSHTHHVTEKRAPTDESVRLLREMEQAALDKLLKSVRLDGNEFKCVVHHLLDPMTLDRRFLVQARINGREVRLDTSVTESLDKEAVIEELVSRLARRLAVELLGPSFAVLHRSL